MVASHPHKVEVVGSSPTSVSIAVEIFFFAIEWIWRHRIVYGDLVYSYIFKMENHYKSARTERAAVAFKGGLKEMWKCHPLSIIYSGVAQLVVAPDC